MDYWLKMKFSQKIYNFIILIGLVSLFLFFYETKYDEVDISNALKSAVSNLKDNQQVIVFDSKNPFNFYDVLNNLDKVSSQEVYGILTYPDMKKDEYPVVIGVAGSLGWSEHHYGYMDRYLDMGIATFTLHSFESRGVTSTVGEQVSVTIPMIVHDAYMALAALSSKDNLDVTRVGITGWSLGGGVSLFTAWQPIKDEISPDFQFAAHLPFYPPCIVEPSELKFTGSPIHVLIGELDNWVPAEPCVEMIESLKLDGYNADITVYSDSHHSFDRNMEVKTADHAYSLTDCRLTLSNSGVVKTKDYGFPLSNGTLQKIGLYFCADRGPSLGGNKEAREASKVFAQQFMSTYLLK